MGFCLRHRPRLQCQRCMSKLAGGHSAQPRAFHALRIPPHMQQQTMMVGTLHGRLRQTGMRPVVHLVPDWLLHAGQAGSLTKPTLSTPKPYMQSTDWMPCCPLQCPQLPVPSQERPALSLHVCRLQVQQHCQRFGMRATLTDPALLRALVDVESCPPAPIQQGNTIVGQAGLTAESPELQRLEVL